MSETKSAMPLRCSLFYTAVCFLSIKSSARSFFIRVYTCFVRTGMANLFFSPTRAFIELLIPHKHLSAIAEIDLYYLLLKTLRLGSLFYKDPYKCVGRSLIIIINRTQHKTIQGMVINNSTFYKFLLSDVR